MELLLLRILTQKRIQSHSNRLMKEPSSSQSIISTKQKMSPQLWSTTLRCFFARNRSCIQKEWTQMVERATDLSECFETEFYFRKTGFSSYRPKFMKRGARIFEIKVNPENGDMTSTGVALGWLVHDSTNWHQSNLLEDSAWLLHLMGPRRCKCEWVLVKQVLQIQDSNTDRMLVDVILKILNRQENFCIKEKISLDKVITTYFRHRGQNREISPNFLMLIN